MKLLCVLAWVVVVCHVDEIPLIFSQFEKRITSNRGVKTKSANKGKRRRKTGKNKNLNKQIQTPNTHQAVECDKGGKAQP